MKGVRGERKGKKRMKGKREEGRRGDNERRSEGKIGGKREEGGNDRGKGRGKKE